MASRGLPPRTVAALYAAAGVLFVVGAFNSGRPAFSGVGVAFIVLAALIYLRRPGKD
ncbi:MFS transporter [Pseudoxanthomonas kaohsiungensis]|uniref:MFS transporter n=1 Tax=Pseudoxanthomonas kaohsiungensis TaxID=283923 RepID=UPI0035B1D9FC